MTINSFVKRVMVPKCRRSGIWCQKIKHKIILQNEPDIIKLRPLRKSYGQNSHAYWPIPKIRDEPNLIIWDSFYTLSFAKLSWSPDISGPFARIHLCGQKYGFSFQVNSSLEPITFLKKTLLNQNFKKLKCVEF